MNYFDHLEKARAELELGHLFEASSHLSKASELLENYGPEYQAGIDAVASCHSKLERMIAGLEGLARRLDTQIMPRWNKVLLSEAREPSKQERSKPIPKTPKISEPPLGGPEDSDDGPFPEESDDE